MAETHIAVRHTGVTVVENEAIDRLAEESDGDAALVYLYLLRSDRPEDEETTAHALSLSKEQVRRATSALREYGLLTATDKKARQPGINPEIICEKARQDPVFKELQRHYEKTAGRILKNGRELGALFDAYDRLKLPAPVVMMLVTGLAQAHKLSAARLEKEALLWAEKQINTVERAEEHLKSCGKLEETKRYVAALLRIGGRELSPSEEKYLSRWLEMGFPPETVERAYDRTVLNTGALKWGYMNRILENWHEKGLHSLTEVDKEKPGQAIAGLKTGVEGGSPEGDSRYAEEVQRYLENKRKGT